MLYAIFTKLTLTKDFFIESDVDVLRIPMRINTLTEQANYARTYVRFKVLTFRETRT